LEAIDLQDTHFVIISKSGTTIETLSIYKYLMSIHALDRSNTTIISGHDSSLASYARKHAIRLFEVPDDVGGRFSVFSVVGLVPLALVGVDIANMLRGAQKVNRSFFAQKEFYDLLMGRARFLVENKQRFNINILFSYSSALKTFNDWYVQLWAESLGKINFSGTRQGLTPIGLVGPVDQHSFLQLIMEGVRDKTVTFIKVDDFEEQIFIPHDTDLPDLPYVEGVSFSRLITMQADATIQAIADQRDIPFDVITIDKVDEYNIAELMYSYELLVSIIGTFLRIDSYNQPGVESGKKILREMLDAKKEKIA
jgi:glucose-6-phosphate isomerase